MTILPSIHAQPMATLAALLTFFFTLPASAQAGDAELPDLRDTLHIELTSGTTTSFSAAGITRITVDDVDTVTPRVSEDGSRLTLEARQSGVAHLTLVLQNSSTPHPIDVHVTDDPPNLQSVIHLSRGQSSSFPAQTLKRVSIANAAIVRASHDNDEGILDLEAIAPGETLVHLYDRDARSPETHRIIVTEDR